MSQLTMRRFASVTMATPRSSRSPGQSPHMQPVSPSPYGQMERRHSASSIGTASNASSMHLPGTPRPSFRIPDRLRNFPKAKKDKVELPSPKAPRHDEVTARMQEVIEQLVWANIRLRDKVEGLAGDA